MFQLPQVAKNESLQSLHQVGSGGYQSGIIHHEVEVLNLLKQFELVGSTTGQDCFYPAPHVSSVSFFCSVLSTIHL